MTTLLRVAGESSKVTISAKEIGAVKYITQGVVAGTLEVTLRGSRDEKDEQNFVYLRKVSVEEADRFVSEWEEFLSTNT